MRKELTKRFNELSPELLEDHLEAFRETRLEHLENQKKVSILALSRGAMCYLQTLTECFQIEIIQDDDAQDEKALLGT